MEAPWLLWAHFWLLIDFLMLSPPVLDSSLPSAFGRKLLPLPSVPDFPESPARRSCPLHRLFGLINFFLLFLPCPHQNAGIQTSALCWGHREAHATSHSPPYWGEEPQLSGKQGG